MGLIDQMVAPDAVYDAAMTWAERFVDYPTQGLAAAKASFGADEPLGEEHLTQPVRLPCMTKYRPGSEPARHSEQVEGPATTPSSRRCFTTTGSRKLRREVVDLLRQALRRRRARPLRRDRATRRATQVALRARAGAGLRQRVLPAEPDSGRSGAARLGPTCRRAWSRWPPQRRKSGLEIDAGSPMRRASRRRRHLRPRRRHAVLHHIPDVELSLREVVRVLKPGGRWCSPRTDHRRHGYARTLSTLTWGRHQRHQAARPQAAGAGRRPSSTSCRARRRWRRSSTCTHSIRASWGGWSSAPAP